MAFPVLNNMDEENEDNQVSGLSTGAGNIGQDIGSCNQSNADLDTRKLQKTLVYTTRLDDMNVFQMAIKYSDPEELTKTIIMESKPKFSLNVSNCPELNKNKLMSFKQLNEKIEDFNAMQQIKSKFIHPPENHLIRQSETAPTSSDEEDLPLDVYRNKEQMKPGKCSYVMINDKDTYTTEVYYLNGKGNIVNARKTRSTSFDKSYFVDKSAEIIQLNPCCWINREEKIKSLKKLCSYTAIQYLKIIHMCPLNKCQCCCRKNKNHTIEKTLSEDNSTEAINYRIDEDISVKNEDFSNDSKELLTLEEPGIVNEREKHNELNKQLMNVNDNNWVIEIPSHLSSSLQTPMNVIQDTVKYEPYSPPNNFDIAKNTNSGNYLNSVQIEPIGSKPSFSDATSSAREAYVIGPNRENHEHFESNYVINEYKSNDNFRIKETMLQKRTNALNRIKTPHKCPDGECGYCCQRVVKPANSHIPLNNVVLPDFPILTSDSANNVECSETLFTIAQNTDNILALRKNLDYSETTNQNHTIGNLTSAVVNFGDSNVFSPSCASTAPDVTFNISSNTVGNVVSKFKNKLDSSQIELLVTSILKKLQDIRLFINADMKIAAELNTHINRLSIVDLKVLRTILKLAQNQVDSLGLIPGIKLRYGLNPLTPADTNAKVLSPTDTANVTNSRATEKNISDSSKTNNFFDSSVSTPTIKPTTINDPNLYVYRTFVTLASKKRRHYLNAFQDFITTIDFTKNIDVDITHRDVAVSLPADVGAASTLTNLEEQSEHTWAKKRTNYGTNTNISETSNKRVRIEAANPSNIVYDDRLQPSLEMELQNIEKIC